MHKGTLVVTAKNDKTYSPEWHNEAYNFKQYSQQSKKNLLKATA